MSQPDFQTCPQCGADLRHGSRFCSQCGSRVAQDADVKESSPRPESKRARWLVISIIAVAFLVLFSTYLRVLFRQYHPVIEEQPEIVIPIDYGLETKTPSTEISVRLDGDDIVVPLELIKRHKLVRFADPGGVQTIPLIAYVTPEGKIVTAMSLSENCRSTDFYLQGHNIHCAACPSYWNMSSLEAYACCQRYYPDPIPSSLVGNEIRISLQRVRNWQPRS